MCVNTSGIFISDSFEKRLVLNLSRKAVSIHFTVRRLASCVGAFDANFVPLTFFFTTTIERVANKTHAFFYIRLSLERFVVCTKDVLNPR